MIFDLSRLTIARREQVERAIRSISFDFERLRPGMRAQGIRAIVVAFGDLDDAGARAAHRLRRKVEGEQASTLGLWYTDGRIALSNDLNDLGVRVVFALEAAHAVDQLLLDDEARQEIAQTYVEDVGPSARAPAWWDEAYEDQIGEAFMFAFVQAYTTHSVRDVEFRVTTPRVIAAVRRVLSPGYAVTKALREARR